MMFLLFFYFFFWLSVLKVFYFWLQQRNFMSGLWNFIMMSLALQFVSLFVKRRLLPWGHRDSQALDLSMERQADNKILVHTKSGLKARSQIYLCGSRGHGPGLRNLDSDSCQSLYNAFGRADVLCELFSHKPDLNLGFLNSITRTVIWREDSVYVTSVLCHKLRQNSDSHSQNDTRDL